MYNYSKQGVYGVCGGPAIMNTKTVSFFGDSGENRCLAGAAYIEKPSRGGIEGPPLSSFSLSFL